jgi:hypothetical protein
VTEASRYGLHIFPQHAKLLAESAISPEVSRARGYVSADEKAQLARYGFADYQRRAPGLIIPLHRADGSVWGYQLRPDAPRVTKAGDTVKYETPKGQLGGIDIPPGARERIGDPAVPLLVTEGSRKADAAVSAGLACVSLLGVWSWRGTNAARGKVALPDWHDIALNGRRVVLAFDSDVTRKRAVAQALAELARWLEHTRKARVEYLHLPDSGDGKTGLDDYIAAEGAAGIWDLVRPEPPMTDTPTPAKSAHTRTPPADQPKQVCAPDGVCMHTPLLASGADLLAQAAEAVHQLGVTGEDRVIRGTFLTAVSQVLAEPVSLVVKGTSAGGKSYSTRTTLQLFPEEDFYKVTAGSQRSLIYTDEEFRHRTIVMFEATALREVAEARDGDMTAMIVRTLLSEGQIIYDVTERGDDGKMGTRRITKKGPTNLIVTTTASNLHHENETRLLSLTVDESEEQTRAVMVKTAARRNQAEPGEPLDLSPWHLLFHWLKHHGDHRVYIPYADYLATSAAAAVVRMRRDFGVLLGMIEAHAVLHQVTRKRDAYGRIIATPADYQAARSVLAEAFAVSSGHKVKESVRRAVAAVEALGGAESDVTVAQVAGYLKRDRTVVTRGLREATDLGYLANREDKAGRAARYRLGADKLPTEDKPALPDVLPETEDPPEDACTPAQVAHLSPQVTEGCAGVQVCAGGAGPALCTICGEPLDPALVAEGYATHGEEAGILKPYGPSGPAEMVNGWPAGSAGAAENMPGAVA